MRTNLLKHLLPLFLIGLSFTDCFSQSTIDRIKFEEAEEKYLSGNASGALILLNELESKGLRNPTVLHLKILATSNLTSPSYDQVVQFKKDVAYYLSNCDIAGLEDKFKDVYEVEKTLTDAKYDEGKLAAKEAAGHFRDKDYGNALKWYLKAYELGNRSSQVSLNLGIMHQQGMGTGKDDREALKWYTRSANEGHAEAQNNLAALYENGGDGVERNLSEALKWYTSSATQGMAVAQANLGNMYRDGKGVQKNLNTAMEWYRKSAEQGDLDAEYNLGACYAITTPQQAAPLLEKVINNPSQSESRRLSALNMYAETIGATGIPGNFNEAMKWYRGEKQHQRDAAERKKLEERLAAEREEEAKRAAAEAEAKARKVTDLMEQKETLQRQLRRRNTRKGVNIGVGAALMGGGLGVVAWAYDNNNLDETEEIIALICGGTAATGGFFMVIAGLSKSSKDLRNRINAIDTQIGQLSFDYRPGYHGAGRYSHGLGISLTLGR